MKHRDGMFLSTKLWPEQIIITYGHKHKNLLSYKIRNYIFCLDELDIPCIYSCNVISEEKNYVTRLSTYLEYENNHYVPKIINELQKLFIKSHFVHS